ncbi:hypothetical protein M378DRAFT_167911 [Amanita muscaria Koide BX008]|uniref:Uncharacterized protein n=1 Tax=Amanita muscaria (strain Koide BX008) TaxID=946122 RepID=A0A0C2T2I1_AMAMK|nr:hypothetical protein M378DRAFT_167911 [Amanita muscaria Koide BX008]
MISEKIRGRPVHGQSGNSDGTANALVPWTKVVSALYLDDHWSDARRGNLYAKFSSPEQLRTELSEKETAKCCGNNYDLHLHRSINRDPYS